jgi:hypothetical protein
MWWHTVTHGRGKWRGNWVMGWVSNTLHTTSEHSVSSITTVDAHTSAASSLLNWRLSNLNGLVHFGKRRNLVSARAQSHFKRTLTPNIWGGWVLDCHSSACGHQFEVSSNYFFEAGRHYSGHWTAHLVRRCLVFCRSGTVAVRTVWVEGRVQIEWESGVP